MSRVRAAAPGRRAGALLLPVTLAVTLAASGCSSGDSGGAEGADAGPSREAPSASRPAEPAETLDSALLDRARDVQTAQQALSDGGQGAFAVELVQGRARGVLPSVDGAYDFTVPAGSFTAVTEEADRTVRLEYRTRGGRAWSQVLYPGSPLAPDCWYQIALPRGDVAMPAQISTLLYLEPDPDDPRAERDRAVAQLVDVLNAVGLTRLANLLDAEAALARVPVTVRIEGEGDEARFASWRVSGADLLSVLDQAVRGRAAAGEIAAVRDAVRTATWRIAVEPGDPPRIAAPPADRVLVAGDTCR